MKTVFRWGISILNDKKQPITVGICNSRDEAARINTADHDGKGKVVRVMCMEPKAGY